MFDFFLLFQRGIEALIKGKCRMLLDLLEFVLVDYCFNFELYLESCHPILGLRDQEGLTQPSGRSVNSSWG